MSKRKIKTLVNAEVLPSPEDLAGVFWAMDAYEQAIFFNCLANEVMQRDEGFAALSMQLEAVRQERCLNSGGRSCMRAIGEYARNDK